MFHTINDEADFHMIYIVILYILMDLIYLFFLQYFFLRKNLLIPNNYLYIVMQYSYNKYSPNFLSRNLIQLKKYFYYRMMALNIYFRIPYNVWENLYYDTFYYNKIFFRNCNYKLISLFFCNMSIHLFLFHFLKNNVNYFFR